jgi:hypothetical protein
MLGNWGNPKTGIRHFRLASQSWVFRRDRPKEDVYDDEGGNRRRNARPTGQVQKNLVQVVQERILPAR